MTLDELGAVLEHRLSGSRPVSPSPLELARRRTGLATVLDRRGATLFVGFTPASIQYLTLYSTSSTERPTAVLLSRHGDVRLFVPKLRAADAEAQAVDASLEIYPEYPGERHPMELLATLIRRTGPSKVLLEAPSYSSPHGYRGPRLADLLGGGFAIDGDFVQRARMIKSPEEIGLLRHACDWAMWAHWLLQRELRLDLPASAVGGLATGAATRRLREQYSGRTGLAWPLQVSAGFDGQVGIDGTLNHAHRSLDTVIAEGDPVITKASAYVGGYYADIERSLVAGEPSSAYRELFRQARELHAFAGEQVHPGRTVAEIDRHVSVKFAEMGIAADWRHHVGHSVGLLEREEPFLDVGARTVLEPGMVVTIEPGVYREGVGGVRQSDCVLVTEQGYEILTPYPLEP